MSAEAKTRADLINDASLELCHASASLMVMMDAMEGRTSEVDPHIRNALHAIFEMVERAKAMVDDPLMLRTPEPAAEPAAPVRLPVDSRGGH